MSKTNPKISLVLSSGGSRGIAHIGVIKALTEASIPIDLIAASSAGAIVAAFYAIDNDTQKLEDLVLSLDYRRLFTLLLERPTVKAIFPGNKAFSYLEKSLVDRKIQDLSLPLYIVASDLVSGLPYVFDSGDLMTALKASSAIPLVFPPIKFEDKFLVDGGATLPLPVSVAKDNSADFVIASSVYKSLFPQDLSALTKSNLSTIALNSSRLLVASLSKESAKNADFHLDLDIPTINTLNFVKAKSFIDMGYKQTKKKIPELKKLLQANYPSLHL